MTRLDFQQRFAIGEYLKTMADSGRLDGFGWEDVTEEVRERFADEVTVGMVKALCKALDIEWRRPTPTEQVKLLRKQVGQLKSQLRQMDIFPEELDKSIPDYSTGREDEDVDEDVDEPEGYPI